jgi:hypothetical protein
MNNINYNPEISEILKIVHFLFFFSFTTFFLGIKFEPIYCYCELNSPKAQQRLPQMIKFQIKKSIIVRFNF